MADKSPARCPVAPGRAAAARGDTTGGEGPVELSRHADNGQETRNSVAMTTTVPRFPCRALGSPLAWGKTQQPKPGTDRVRQPTAAGEALGARAPAVWRAICRDGPRPTQPRCRPIPSPDVTQDCLDQPRSPTAYCWSRPGCRRGPPSPPGGRRARRGCRRPPSTAPRSPSVI